MRLILSALVFLLPASPVAAQLRVVPETAGVLGSAPAAVAPIGSAAALAPSLSASAVFATPLAAGASLSAAPLPSAAAPAALAPLPMLPAAAIQSAPALIGAQASPLPHARDSASVVPPAANRASASRAPPRGKDEPRVFTSLQDLHRLFATDVQTAGDGAYDGRSRASDGTFSGPANAKSANIASAHGITVKPVRGVPTQESLPEFEPHEIDTIKKIQIRTNDLLVVVREASATPDLIVNGVATELKTVHKGKLARQLAHASGQLLSHAKRHNLGPGAVVLDVIGTPLSVAEVEANIAQAVREEPALGFDRVYVFQGDDLKIYAPAADGAFRLDPAAAPFAGEPSKFAPSRPDAAVSFVPQTLARANLPDMAVVTREIQEPSRRLRARGIEATVTMYGSARIASPEKAAAALAALKAEFGARPKDSEAKKKLAAAREAVRMSKYYRIAQELGALIAKEGAGKVAVVTGGGPGIMEAGNRGAFEAGGPSVGYNIKLPMEQGLNPYATRELEFTFDNFATRKMALRHGSMGLVYFPGGFGTMDELFEVLTLIQTRKMQKVPIVLIGEKAYWEKILDFEEFAHMGLISTGDLSLFTFAEDAPSAWAAIRAAHHVETK
jgi:uncharacterized protein (TIGR00730 family)